MSTPERIVVTGTGAVCALGTGCPEIFANLLAGQSGVGPITHFDPVNNRSKVAAEARQFDPLKHMDRKLAKRIGRYAQFAVAAADEAVRQSGLDFAHEAPERVATVIGTGIADFPWVEEQFHEFFRAPERINAFTVPRMSTNMASALVSLQYGLHGPGLGVTTACATGSHSLAVAWTLLRAGLADVVLAGGTEAAICSSFIAAYEVMGAVSMGWNDDPAHASRPFDKRRDGFVLGEGGAVLVLETESHARARGATVLAEFAGVGMTSDAHHIVAAHPCGRGAAEAIRMALKTAGITPAEVDYINAHGTSTPLNDPVETLAIKTALGSAAWDAAVSSTKSMMGHCIGGAGALEAMACVMAIREQAVPPTINLDEPDETCDLDYVPNVARRRKVDVALSNSFAFGGHNAVLAFRRV